MRKLIAALLFLGVFASTTSFASEALVADIATSSYSNSKSLDVSFHLINWNTECTGEFIETNTGKVLAEAKIEPVSYTKQRAFATISDGYATKEKKLVLRCNLPSEETQTFYHTIPAVPQIILSSSIKGVGLPFFPWGCDMIYCSPGYKYYEYTAQLFVDNRESTGTCYTNGNDDIQLLGVENKSQDLPSFHSDYFSVDKEISSFWTRAVVLSIYCKNTGGTTIRNQVWLFHDENDIRLVQDITDYK